MQHKELSLASESRADLPQTGADGLHEVLPDVAYQRLAIVNVAYLGAPGGPWVLVDAGIPGMAGQIADAAEMRFNRPPEAILITHGHFDHAGSLEALAERWNVPIYAHPFERPYLDGSAGYPPPEPDVGGGMMARLSPLYPRDPVDVSRWLNDLPADGSVPFLTGWRWMHTPGHSVGHVSLWREADGTMLAADAVCTTAQESAYAALSQEAEIHGPPMYFTQNWGDAEASVRRIAALEPRVLLSGHGRPMQGDAMRAALHLLADEFARLGLPEHSRYLDHPVRADDGTAYVPHKKG